MFSNILLIQPGRAENAPTFGTQPDSPVPQGFVNQGRHSLIKDRHQDMLEKEISVKKLTIKTL